MTAHRVDALDAARRARITYRQLDYWTTKGYVRLHKANPGSGNRRSYTEREARVLVAMAELVRAGVTPPLAARVARQIITKGTGRLGRLTVSAGAA